MSYIASGRTEALCTLDVSNESSEYGSQLFSDITDVSTGVNMSPKESPPVQVMERPSVGYDPNRISTCIFGRPSSAMDWSAASSESLFSIQVGITSLSGDQGSKELYKSDELVRMKQASPATKGVDRKKNLDMPKIILDDMKPGGTGREIAEPINDFTHAFRNNRIATSIGQSRDPDQSKISSQLFPLPKKKKSSCLCSLCHCHGCCTWPSCCCKWPSCSCKCLRSPSCFRNCCKWPSCSCKWPSCKCLTCSSCSCKCLTCSSCPSCSFKCLTCPGCSSCNCKCPTCPSCSFKCLPCPSCSCKCLTCPSGCFKCPNWLSCNC